MTSEMIDRVSKAIFEAMDLSDGLDGTAARSYAIAAIEAMRDPTEYMVASGSSMRWDDYRYRDESTKDQWQAMINAALKGNNSELYTGRHHAGGARSGDPDKRV